MNYTRKLGNNFYRTFIRSLRETSYSLCISSSKIISWKLAANVASWRSYHANPLFERVHSFSYWFLL